MWCWRVLTFSLARGFWLFCFEFMKIYVLNAMRIAAIVHCILMQNDCELSRMDRKDFELKKMQKQRSIEIHWCMIHTCIHLRHRYLWDFSVRVVSNSCVCIDSVQCSAHSISLYLFMAGYSSLEDGCERLTQIRYIVWVSTFSIANRDTMTSERHRFLRIHKVSRMEIHLF